MPNSCLIFCLVCNGVPSPTCLEPLVSTFYKWIIHHWLLFFYLLKYIEHCWIKEFDLSSKFKACLTKGIDWMYSCAFMKYNAHVSPIFPKKTNYFIKWIRLKLDSTFWQIVCGQLRLVKRSDGYCELSTEVCMTHKRDKQSCKICVPS